MKKRNSRQLMKDILEDEKERMKRYRLRAEEGHQRKYEALRPERIREKPFD